MKITARIMNGTEVLRSITVDVPDLDTGVTASGIANEEAFKTLVALATDAYVIAAQAKVRGLAALNRKEGRLTDGQIADMMAQWKPGTRTVNRDPVATRAKLAERISKMSDADRAALLELMRPTPAPAPAPVLKKKRA